MPEDVNAFVFPGGKKKTITIAATAGNVTSNKSPGAGFRWLILSIYVTLDTDATVADRYIRYELTDGTVIIFALGGNTTAITANQIKIAQIGPVGGLDDGWAFQDVLGRTTGSASMGLAILEGADQIRTSIIAGVAGDSFTGYIEVLEMKL